MINEYVLQKIDDMNENENYDPYKSLIKSNVSNESLFDDGNYDIQEDDTVLSDIDDRKSKRIAEIIIISVVGITMLSIIAILGYLICTGKFTL